MAYSKLITIYIRGNSHTQFLIWQYSKQDISGATDVPTIVKHEIRDVTISGLSVTDVKATFLKYMITYRDVNTTLPGIMIASWCNAGCPFTITASNCTI